MELTAEELFKYVDENTDIQDDADVLENDCDMIVYLLKNCKINIPTENRFFFYADCEEAARRTFKKRVERLERFERYSEFSDGEKAYAHNGYYDFGHTSTVWESVINLGIYGLRTRIFEYAAKNQADLRKQRFYGNLIRVYDAAIDFIGRVAEKARSLGKNEMAQGLNNLCYAPPSNLFEAMQTTFIYYVLQICFDGTFLRTLGRVDSVFYRYYLNESEETAKELVLDFLTEADRLGVVANIPFALGGTDIHGNTLFNELSYVFLNAYKNADLNSTKIHFLCSENTPDDIIKLAFECIIKGKNSLVFMSDERIIQSLERLGATHRDAVRYTVVGCYECGAEEEITCSCNARANIPKALELALNGGSDMLSGETIGVSHKSEFSDFGELYTEFLRQLEFLCDKAIAVTNLYEERTPRLHSSPILSATYLSSLESGMDIYRDFGARYNNSSLNAVGLATAADSLFAIKKAVFEEKKLTLSELTDILRANWAENEALRLLMKNKYPKYGQGNAEVDEIAKNITDSLYSFVSARPNKKGGKYRLGLFSIDWRHGLGRKTAASADGRFSGETLSQNTSATFGADKNGATAHFISATRLDTSKTPNGAVVDIDLHSSSVKGENGVRALLSSLRGYLALGGFAVHYNVLDTEVLKEAMRYPEKYRGLQVRLCGWNVLFSTLSEKEKYEFIKRSEK